MRELPGLDRNPDRVDAILRALAAGRRRVVLEHLCGDPDGVSSFEDVADSVARSRAGPSDRESVVTELVHKDLPVMQEAGLLEYDTRSRTVRYRSDRIAEGVLNCVEERSAPPQG